MPKKVVKKAAKTMKKAAKAVVARKKTLLKKAVAAVRTTRPAARKKAAAKATKKPARYGDVLGVSSARVPKDTPRATTDRGGNPKGINVRGRTVPGLRPAKVR